MTYHIPTLSESLREAEEIKKHPIRPGFVRFERNSYHYSQQGSVTLAGHLTKDLPESEAANWISGACSLTWPDGAIEMFDTRVTPTYHTPHLGYGVIANSEGTITGTLSRIPNLFVMYYGPRIITPEERATFKMIHDTWGLVKKDEKPCSP